jgi:glycerophosphoryl diester phosphodiesterase
MKQNLRNICSEAATILRRTIGKVLCVHLVYVVAGAALFTPLLGLLGRFLLYFSGQTMLSDMDIAFFALTPAGMIALILFGATLITMIVFEQASLMVLVAGSMQGRDAGIVPALMSTVHRSKDIFLFSLRFVIRVLLLVFPFAVICFAVAWFLLTDYDINYYLAQKPPVFLLAAVCIAVVLIVMAIVLTRTLFNWALALPLVLLEDTPASKSFGESTKRTLGRRRLLVSVFLLWVSAIIFMEMVLLGTVQFVGKSLLVSAMDSIGMLVLFTGGLAALLSVGNFFITALSFGGFASFLLVFARGCGLEIKKIRFPAVLESRTGEWRRLGAAQTALILAGCAVVSLLTGLFLVGGVRTEDDVEIIAHRGAAGRAPENTLASVRQALEDGADWVEIDVQETLDGRIAVIHDSDLMKLAGKELNIWDATLEQLQQVDIGSWFSPEFSNERIPSLEDVLETVKGKAGLLIELKYYGHDQRLEQRVADIVEQTDMLDSVALMSLKRAGIEKARNLRPDWPYGLLTSKTIGDLSSLQMDFLAINMATTSPGLIRRIQKAGKQVYVWTVNDRMSMSRMMSLGVDGIITDEPKLARQVLTERAELNFSERLLLHAAIFLGRPVPSKTYRDNSP